MEHAVPRVKLWVESGGRLVMSDYRLRLLQLVEETGSLSRAAATLGLSYRRAWGKVKEIEANLGIRLVASESGGAGGGHTSLTPEAVSLLSAYREFQERAEAAVEDAFRHRLRALISGPADR